jgi:hypothetical protein
MKIIKFEEAYKLLLDCAACIVADNVVIYPCLYDDPDNEVFLRFAWEENGFEFELEFNYADNQVVGLSGSSLFLKSTAGAEEQITLLKTWDAETEK